MPYSTELMRPIIDVIMPTSCSYFIWDYLDVFKFQVIILFKDALIIIFNSNFLSNIPELITSNIYIYIYVYVLDH